MNFCRRMVEEPKVELDVDSNMRFIMPKKYFLDTLLMVLHLTEPLMAFSLYDLQF